MSLGQPLTEDEGEASTAMGNMWGIWQSPCWSLLLQKMNYGFIQSVESFLSLHAREKSASNIRVLLLILTYWYSIMYMLNNN